jgi:hypothetical protein
VTRDLRFALSQELEAKQTLLDQLRALATDDFDFFTDLLEGETNLLELIAALDSSIVDDEILVDGAKAALELQAISSARDAARRSILAIANDGRRSEAAHRSCPMDQAEPYGECLTYGPGHYETWDHWRRDRTVDAALRAIVGSYEYEDWSRGRIVFDRSRDLFILYADRKLLTRATIARIETHFRLPAERTETQSDWHYQSTETPNRLGTRSTRRY